MSLLAPAWLLLCALSALVLLLHARRRKTVEIPSIQIWRQLEGGRHARRPIRRPPFNLALLLQLLVVAFSALLFGRFCLGAYVFHLLRGEAAFANSTLPWARRSGASSRPS